MIDETTLNMELLMGKECVICIDNIYIRPYTIRQLVKNIGLDTYYKTIGLCKITLDQLVDDNQEELKLFNVLLYNDMLRESFINFLDVFICHDDDGIRYIEQFNEIMITYNGKAGRIGERNIQDVFNVVKKMYCMNQSKKKESDRKDIDDEMKQLLLEFEEEENKIRNAKGAEITLDSIVEAISVKHPSLNLYNIWDSTIYQLMRTYYRIEQVDNNTHVINAVYAGTIDSKKANLEESHWAKKLDV